MCALPGGHSFFSKKKNGSGQPSKKTLSVPLRRSEMILCKISQDFLRYQKNFGSEILQRTAQKL